MAATILGTTDVALRSGCSAERVRQLEREGKLSAVKTPRGVRIFNEYHPKVERREKTEYKPVDRNSGEDLRAGDDYNERG